MNLNEKAILKFLANQNNPLLLREIAEQLECDSKSLEQYLNSFSDKGLVVISKKACKDDEKYSPDRGKNVYSASSVTREYLKKQSRDFITFVCTIIAAIMASLTLIATLIIPFFG